MDGGAVVIDPFNHPVKPGPFTVQVVDGITGLQNEFGEDRYLDPQQRDTGWPALHLYPIRNRQTWDAAAATAWLTEWVRWSLPGGCDCAGHWSNLIKTNPPRFDTPDDFFAWGNEAHNEVNARVDRDGSHPPVPLAQATEIWSRIAAAGQVAWFRPVKDTIKAGSRLVITIATGKAREWLRVTEDSMQAYARNWGADFVALKDTTQGWWGLEKFRVHEFAKQYEETLYLDADVLVTKAALADEYWLPQWSSLGMHNEYGYLPSASWVKPSWREVAKCLGAYMSPPMETSLNSGVVYCRREYADVWHPPKLPIPTSHVAEQVVVGMNFLKFECETHELPEGMNLQVWNPRFEELLPTAAFVHASGRDKKLELLKTLAEQLNAAGNPPLSLPKD